MSSSDHVQSSLKNNRDQSNSFVEFVEKKLRCDLFARKEQVLRQIFNIKLSVYVLIEDLRVQRRPFLRDEIFNI